MSYIEVPGLPGVPCAPTSARSSSSVTPRKPAPCSNFTASRVSLTCRVSFLCLLSCLSNVSCLSYVPCLLCIRLSLVSCLTSGVFATSRVSLKAPIHFRAQSDGLISCYGKPVERTNEFAYLFISLVRVNYCTGRDGDEAWGWRCCIN